MIMLSMIWCGIHGRVNVPPIREPVGIIYVKLESARTESDFMIAGPVNDLARHCHQLLG